MKINIEGKCVTIEDDSGGILIMRTDQLIAMMKVLNIAIREDNSLVFNPLEFTV